MIPLSVVPAVAKIPISQYKGAPQYEQRKLFND